jgi:DNA primase large subunit
MYLQGKSLREIAQTLHVSEHTVIKWRNEDDWDLRKDAVVRDAVRIGDAERAESLAASLERSLVEMDEILKRALHLAEPRSLEGIVRARLEIMRVIREYAQSRSGENVDSVIEAVIEAIIQHPKLRPVIERYRDEIIESVQQNLRRRGVLA